MMVFRGTVERVSDVAGPTHGDVAKIGTTFWIFDGRRGQWRRLRKQGEVRVEEQR